MPTAQKGLIQVELGQAMNDFAVMTDSGDHQTFTISGGPIWSNKSGKDPDLRPNGIVSGVNLLSTHADNNKVTIAGFTAYSKGVEHTVAATTATVVRPSMNDYKIDAITMDEDGDIAVVEGTESTAFSATWGAAGGPPLIPVDSVLIGIVKMSSQSAAVIDEDEEIFQDAGDSAEYADYPIPEIYTVGKGIKATVAAEKNAFVKFNTTFPLAHTGDVPKRVYLKYYTPALTTLSRTAEFKAAEVGVTKTSESTYEGSGVSGAIGSMKADSVGDASFTFFAQDGITDPLVKERNEIVTVKFFPDPNKSPYLLTQGMLGVDRNFPAGEQIKIDCTVYCEKETIEFSS
jgi:hypothetical protein